MSAMRFCRHRVRTWTTRNAKLACHASLAFLTVHWTNALFALHAFQFLASSAKAFAPGISGRTEVVEAASLGNVTTTQAALAQSYFLEVSRAMLPPDQDDASSLRSDDPAPSLPEEAPGSSGRAELYLTGDYGSRSTDSDVFSPGGFSAPTDAQMITPVPEIEQGCNPEGSVRKDRSFAAWAPLDARWDGNRPIRVIPQLGGRLQNIHIVIPHLMFRRSMGPLGNLGSTLLSAADFHTRIGQLERSDPLQTRYRSDTGIVCLQGLQV